MLAIEGHKKLEAAQQVGRLHHRAQEALRDIVALGRNSSMPLVPALKQREAETKRACQECNAPVCGRG